MCVDYVLKKTVPLLMAVEATRSTRLTAMLVRFRTTAGLRFVSVLVVVDLAFGQARIGAVAMVYHIVLSKPVSFVPTLQMVDQLIHGHPI